MNVAKIKINFSILIWRDLPLSQATIKCDFTVHTEFNLCIFNPFHIFYASALRVHGILQQNDGLILMNFLCIRSASRIVAVTGLLVSQGGLCGSKKPYIWIPHVLLRMLTNFQLSRTTSYGIIAFCKIPFADRPFPYPRDSTQMCDETSPVSN